MTARMTLILSPTYFTNFKKSDMKIKAVLTILISLILGFIFGYLTAGQFIKRDMKKRHTHSYTEMFVHKTLNVIEPAEIQKDSLMPIINDYAEKSLELKNKVSGEFDSLVQKMQLDLKPFLTDDQFRKLEESNKNIKQRYGK